ncbi:histidine kinase [Tsukamurella sp. 8F]|uniref:sensor histidine kinase n=1 Tax=unclassified Tsukamurella TaxID=2633480 RepID=UPI0023B9301E|nr:MULTISPECIES: histidine kinase [unclassified Tsukamurella]MDF0528792.1 histidine kinase [Tsukamurella sp. 8J]MDF0586627.1 histidine kinase [Tsukamurella sp. 8F]
MRWLEARYRRAFALIGYEYPPSYMFITDLGSLSLLISALVPRLLDGPRGIQWLWLALAASASLCTVVGVLFDRKKLSIALHTAVVIASAALFWMVPTAVDAVPMLLVLCATTAAAVTPLRIAFAHLVALDLTLLAAGIAHRVPQMWLWMMMLCFGSAVGYLLQNQLQLLRAERRQRIAQEALDRAAIAREVHDVVAHSLSIVLLNVTGARRALQEDADPTSFDVEARAEALDALRDAEQQGRAAMTDVRRTIALLREDTTPSTPQPGLGDLRELVAGFHRAGSKVSLRLRDPFETLTSATELAAFRVVQESLSNAAKHAPGTRVDVTVGPEPGYALAVRIRNVLPADVRAQAGGSGVGGMRDRVESVGGSLRAGPDDGAWRVEALFPAEPAAVRNCPVRPRLEEMT